MKLNKMYFRKCCTLDTTRIFATNGKDAKCNWGVGDLWVVNAVKNRIDIVSTDDTI